MTTGTCRRAEAGLTLLEMLVALSILALAGSLSAVMVGRSLAIDPLDQAVARLTNDLASAQLRADAGETVILHLAPNGYGIERGGETRTQALDDSVRVRWEVSLQGEPAGAAEIRLPARPTPLGLRAELRRGEERVLVVLEPLTGRVHRE